MEYWTLAYPILFLSFIILFFIFPDTYLSSLRKVFPCAVASVLKAALVHGSHEKILEGPKKKGPLFMPSDSVFCFVWVTHLLPPKLGALCPHLCKERRAQELPLAACHWARRGGRSQCSVCSLPPSWHLSAICLLPTSFDLSLTFCKTSLSCLKDTIILNCATSGSSPQPNAFQSQFWFWKNSKQLLEHLPVTSGELLWTYPLLFHTRHVLERRGCGVRLCSRSKGCRFLNLFSPLVYILSFLPSSFLLVLRVLILLLCLM